MKHLCVLQWLLCRHTLHNLLQRWTPCCCPCVTPSALLLCVSVPREPQGCGGRWPSVHHEKKAGAAARGAGAHGATATCMTTRVDSATPRLGPAVEYRASSSESFNTIRTVFVDTVYPPQSIESRLKLILPEDLGPFLMDGVVLCHLANHIQPCSVAGIHVPSPAAVGLPLSAPTGNHRACFRLTDRLCFQPKLGMAKCRRNVENFLEACRKLGVPEVRPPSLLLFV